VWDYSHKTYLPAGNKPKEINAKIGCKWIKVNGRGDFLRGLFPMSDTTIQAVMLT
jgi:hypothetical protein